MTVSSLDQRKQLGGAVEELRRLRNDLDFELHSADRDGLPTMRLIRLAAVGHSLTMAIAALSQLEVL